MHRSSALLRCCTRKCLFSRSHGTQIRLTSSVSSLSDSVDVDVSGFENLRDPSGPSDPDLVRELSSEYVPYDYEWVHAMGDALVWVHTHTHAPWWAVVAGTAVGIRVAFLPALFAMRRRYAHVGSLAPYFKCVWIECVCVWCVCVLRVFVVRVCGLCVFASRF